ncbi:putative ribonuclease H protein [Trifolium medium]|uniref:Putative ribonuclease H protein n=1 Tax=Trifolium medium TaxID=97028 RepID=A0A392M9P0_9FABA|nr:putative ribonuclease H protein [Trifolium medium]
MVWHQKSRAQWIKDGDRNTRYYHLKTLNRQRKNKIIMLRAEDGSWVEDEGQLQSMSKKPCLGWKLGRHQDLMDFLQDFIKEIGR